MTDDQGFIEKLAAMLKVDESEAEARAEALDGDAFLELTDAVNANDRELAMRLLDQSADQEEGEDADPTLDAFSGEFEDEFGLDLDNWEEPEDGVEPIIETSFAIGDHVRFGKEKGIVQIPDGPSDTVGVLVDKKLRMVDRARLRLDETYVQGGLMGFVDMPAINRMRALAGLPETGAPSIEAVVVEPAGQRVATPLASAAEPELDAALRANRAIDDLCANLPDVRVRDLPNLRKKLLGVIERLNERQGLARRRKL